MAHVMKTEELAGNLGENVSSLRTYCIRHERLKEGGSFDNKETSLKTHVGMRFCYVLAPERKNGTFTHPTVTLIDNYTVKTMLRPTVGSSFPRSPLQISF